MNLIILKQKLIKFLGIIKYREVANMTFVANIPQNSSRMA